MHGTKIWAFSWSLVFTPYLVIVGDPLFEGEQAHVAVGEEIVGGTMMARGAGAVVDVPGL
jgi:hypothetical protein